MNIAPNLEINYKQEFNIKDNDSCGFCCFWSSRAVKRPDEYYVRKDGSLEALKNTTKSVKKRIEANRRLARLVQDKFRNDPIDQNEAFDMLRERINHNFENGDRITEEKLIAIVNAMYAVKREVNSKSEKKTAFQTSMENRKA